MNNSSFTTLNITELNIWISFMNVYQSIALYKSYFSS
jgi:hypothetical protein